ncbi:MAG: acyltransferase [Filimonas sp.]|nr:acyltransferase [Filimonas sp.]
MQQRLVSLDGLRTLSILIVLFAHLSITKNFPASNVPVESILTGDMGVNIFFVISGFLITLLLLKEENTKGEINIKHFYIRRIFRILPVYYFFLATCFLCLNFKIVPDILIDSFIPPLTFTTGTLPIKTGWTLGHTWSLSIEEQFYLIWPALLICIKKKRNRNILLIFIISITPVARILYYYHFRDLSYMFILRGDCLMMGCLLAINKDMIQLFYQKIKAKYLVGISIFSISLLLNYLSSSGSMGSVTIPLTFFLHGILGVYLIVANTLTISNKNLFSRFLNLKPVVYLGKLSYSLYIWQQFFLQNRTTAISGVKLFPINIVLVFIVGYLSYRLIETPVLKLKDRIARPAVSVA